MATNLATRIKNLYPTMSKAHKKIANVIMNDHPKISEMTASRLAAYLNISNSTIIRFAYRLGYEGYHELQHEMRELAVTIMTYNQRIDHMNKLLGDKKDVVNCIMEADIDRIRYTMDKIDRLDFDRTVTAITKARRIYVAGARNSEYIARLLHYNLSLIFDNVFFVNPNSNAEIYEQLISINEADMLIAFSFPRYSVNMISAVKYASLMKAQVISITDSQNSPIAEYSSHILIAQSDMASFADSLVAPLSLVNLIVSELTRRLEGTLKERFDKLESIWKENNVYADTVQ